MPPEVDGMMEGIVREMHARMMAAPPASGDGR